MMQIDPTTVATEGSTSSEEELSVDIVAQMQEFLMTNGGAPRGKGNPRAGVRTTAERTTLPTALGVADHPISPPVPQPAPGLAPQPIPAAPPQPLPPIPLPLLKRKVSGRYRSAGQVWQVELRCDVDGRHPLGRVSADYYSVTGATVHYFGSMRVDTPTIS